MLPDGDEDEIPDELFPPEPEAPDAASEQGLRKQRTRSRLRQKESDRFWQSQLATEIGRRELWRVLEAAGAFNVSFACGPNGFPQPEATWFQFGQTQFGQRLFFSWQRIDPQGVLLMQQENDPRFQRKKG